MAWDIRPEDVEAIDVSYIRENVDVTFGRLDRTYVQGRPEVRVEIVSRRIFDGGEDVFLAGREMLVRYMEVLAPLDSLMTQRLTMSPLGPVDAAWFQRITDEFGRTVGRVGRERRRRNRQPFQCPTCGEVDYENRQFFACACSRRTDGWPAGEWPPKLRRKPEPEPEPRLRPTGRKIDLE